MSRGKTSRASPLKRLPKATAGVAANALSPNEVINNLAELFDDLGLDIKMLNATGSRKILAKKGVPHPYPRHLEIGKLLGAWHQDHKYLDQNGNPLPLKRSGSCPSFGELSNKISPSLNSSLVLKHLEKIGAVTIDEKKRIHVQMRSIPVYLDRSFAVEYTLNTLNGFIRTLRHNLSCTPSNSNQLFHRIASSAQFDPAQIPALKVRIKRYGQNFLESCDSWMLRRSHSKVAPSRRQRKFAQVSVGVYLTIDGT